LYFALKSQRYRHTPTTTHGIKRTKKWNTFSHLVVQDRAANEAAATQARLGAGGVENIDDAGDDIDEDAAPAIDPLFYN
jgi:hypothetical protein